MLLYKCYAYIAIQGCRQAVRHQTLTLACVGSNPATPAIIFMCRTINGRHILFCTSIISSTKSSTNITKSVAILDDPFAKRTFEIMP